MKQKIMTLFLFVSCICLLTGCMDTTGNIQQNTSDSTVFRENNDTQENSSETEPLYYDELTIGDTAPDFTATLADGSTFTLSEHSGSVILLNFWATWCGPCVEEMPAFEQLDSEYGDEVTILAVNCMEDQSTVDRFISANGYTFPIAYDVSGDISMKYPTAGIPYTVVIGTDGIIRNIYVGAYSADVQYQEYKAAIENALP